MTYYLLDFPQSGGFIGDIYDKFPKNFNEARFKFISNDNGLIKSRREMIDTMHDGMVYILSGGRKKIDIDIFLYYNGYLCSREMLTVFEECSKGLFKAVAINLINRKNINIDTNIRYYAMLLSEEENVIDFSAISEDGIYHKEILGDIKLGIENGKKIVVRSPRVVFKENLPSIFVYKGTLFCGEEFRSECLRKNINGINFYTDSDLIIVDFERDGSGGIVRGEDLGRNFTRFETRQNRAKWTDIVSDRPLNPYTIKSIEEYNGAKKGD